MNLNEYMNRGISLLLKTAGRYYFNNPRGIAFLAKTVPEIKKNAKRRQRHEEAGLHVPPFLIASITSSCNLHCAGCYARAAGACTDGGAQDMTAAEWQTIFAEASALGISFILLAGGEPMVRRDVLEASASFPNMVFPVFTNGTMMDEAYLKLFERHRNLIPVFSIEGGRRATDARRGEGAYRAAVDAMAHFRKRKILFGASITVTKANSKDVTQACFVEDLRQKGCGLVFFVEYVPVEPDTERLSLGDTDRKDLQKTVDALRDRFPDTILVSFPGDEEAAGGCLASGRGFFHISANGGAEPCPFSPHSQLNLRESTIEDALRSGFFLRLREIAVNAGHHGGCTLFEHKEEVEALTGGTAP